MRRLKQSQLFYFVFSLYLQRISLSFSDYQLAWSVAAIKYPHTSMFFFFFFFLFFFFCFVFFFHLGSNSFSKSKGLLKRAKRHKEWITVYFQGMISSYWLRLNIFLHVLWDLVVCLYSLQHQGQMQLPSATIINILWLDHMLMWHKASLRRSFIT